MRISILAPTVPFVHLIPYGLRLPLFLMGGGKGGGGGVHMKMVGPVGNKKSRYV